MKKPRLEDYYCEHDPRGCSTSELREYAKACEEYENYLKECKRVKNFIQQPITLGIKTTNLYESTTNSN